MTNPTKTLSKNLQGVFTALITPFVNGEVDYKSLGRLLHQQINGGVTGFVVNGTTAESPTLSSDEKKAIFAFVKKETDGKFPLIFGSGTNSTAESIRLTKEAAGWGADAALVVVPYYNKPPQRGLFQHFQKISECSPLPVILYNVPSRTITKLEHDTIVELSRLPNVIGIKEASGDIEFGRRLVEDCTTDFSILSGDDGSFIDLMAVGGQGVISVASHILPKEFSRWCKQGLLGDHSAIEEFSKYRDLNNYLYVEANPIPLKTALYHMGIIESPELRLPLVQLGSKDAIEMKNKLRTLGLV